MRSDRDNFCTQSASGINSSHPRRVTARAWRTPSVSAAAPLALRIARRGQAGRRQSAAAEAVEGDAAGADVEARVERGHAERGMRGRRRDHRHGHTHPDGRDEDVWRRRCCHEHERDERRGGRRVLDFVRAGKLGQHISRQQRRNRMRGQQRRQHLRTITDRDI